MKLSELWSQSFSSMAPGKICYHWFRLWIVTYNVPSHCLNQCCLSVNQTLRNKLSENFIKIKTFSCKKIHLKMPSAKCQPLCLGLEMKMSKWHNAKLSQYEIIEEYSHLFILKNAINSLVKTAVTPLLKHWSCCSLALSPGYIHNKRYTCNIQQHKW